MFEITETMEKTADEREALEAKVEKREGYDYVVNRYFICGVNADGTAFRDTTHQCEEGSKWVTSMIAELLKNSDFSLKEYLK